MIKMSEKITYTKIKTLFKKTDKTKTEIDSNSKLEPMEDIPQKTVNSVVGFVEHLF